jgi:hypothetical protein
MSSRGIAQLARLNLVYSDYAHSSQTFREFLLSEFYLDFKRDHPTIEFRPLMSRNTHPYVTAFYINGYLKEIPLRLRNLPEIVEDLTYLASSCALRSRPRAS